MFGRLLVAAGAISEEQLEQALAEQAGGHMPLGRLLVSLGFATEDAIVEALNRSCGLGLASLDDDVDARLNAWRMQAGRGRGLRVPLRLKLGLSLIVLLLVTVAGLGGVLLNRQSDQLFRQAERTGLVSLRHLATNARLPLLEEDVLQLNALARELSQVEGVRYAVVTDTDGIVRAHSDPARLDKPLELPAPPPGAATRDSVTRFEYVDVAGTRVLSLSRPVTFQDKALGTARVGLSLDFIRREVRREMIVLALFTGGAVLLGVLVALRLSGGLSRRVGTLVEATREIARGNLKHRVARRSNDELGDLALAFNYMTGELAKKESMHSAFGKYVGSEVLHLVLNEDNEELLKGHRSTVTVLFTDIRGFTAYSEDCEPEALVEQLNAYFDIATRHIRARQGYVDKFIGDAVMGVFGAPNPHPNHAADAVRAAISMQRELAQVAEETDNALLRRVGIGINTGPVVAGNIGSGSKLEYTAIGDAVNVASRLNGLAGAGEVVISESVYDVASGILDVSPLGAQSVKGKSQPIQAYRVKKVFGL